MWQNICLYLGNGNNERIWKSSTIYREILYVAFTTKRSHLTNVPHTDIYIRTDKIHIYVKYR